VNTTSGRYPVHVAIAAGVMLLACSVTVFAEPAGRVLFVAGNVRVTDPTGNVRALERGASVEEGDTIATHDGRVQVQFKDGAFLALQPETRFRVERYRYTAAGDAEDSVVMSLIKGGLRTISGLVGKKHRDDYRMDSAVATIGIRGTDYALELDTTLSGHVAAGAIEVCNGGGCALVQSGFAFSVPSFIDRPVLGERRAFLPPPPSDQSRARTANKRDDAAANGGEGQVRAEDKRLELPGKTDEQRAQPSVADGPEALDVERKPGKRMRAADAVELREQPNGKSHRDPEQVGAKFDALPPPGAAGNAKPANTLPAAAHGPTRAGDGPGKSGRASGTLATTIVPAMGASTTTRPTDVGQDKRIPPGLINKLSNPLLDLTGPPGLGKNTR
jgi:hypothetical protein